MKYVQHEVRAKHKVRANPKAIFRPIGQLPRLPPGYAIGKKGEELKFHFLSHRSSLHLIKEKPG
jgi:hypothetical protein